MYAEWPLVKKGPYAKRYNCLFSFYTADVSCIIYFSIMILFTRPVWVAIFLISFLLSFQALNRSTAIADVRFFQPKANTRLFSINIMLSSSYAVLTKHFLDHEAKKKKIQRMWIR